MKSCISETDRPGHGLEKRDQEEIMCDWEQAWLAYEAIEDQKNKKYFEAVYTEQSGELTQSALGEIETAAKKLFGISVRKADNREAAGIILEVNPALDLGPEGYQITEEKGRTLICGAQEKGLLYGTFRFLLMVSSGEEAAGVSIREIPQNPVRMLNQWDNIDGSIERGYSGKSFFYEGGKVTVTERIKDYARMLCSVGINAISINNVNVREGAEWLITDRHYKELEQAARIFGKYGISMYLCIDFAAPMTLDGLSCADPLNEEVRSWWENKCREIFKRIPNMGGFLVKADSEGRPGPFAYGRNHADGANMLARAVKPYGGTIIWRCFVYNCQQDWRDRKTDRACAGYDNFMPLDGKFDENVILQIKNGPIDFQVREPVHPLFGGLQHTNQMLEVQIAQEYTGQQIDVCYLVPMWKEVLNFSTGCGKSRDTVADIISGRTFGQQKCGMAAVANTGRDANWTGHDLAGANLYGFGRLAWNPGLSAEEIVQEWISLQVSRDSDVKKMISEILLRSRAVYEKYTAPLGIGFMVNPAYHYGPNPEGYEYSKWGTYHRADHKAVGVDRSDKGTGYSEQYFEKNAAVYRDMESCPENLLLFFHRVPYTHRLRSGKTLIQHIYDSHFEGYADVLKMQSDWEHLEGKIPQHIFERVKERFAHQAENSHEWCDVINSFFYRKSMIADEQGREIF